MRAGVIGVLLSTGCATGVTLVEETPNGGIVAYPFKDERGGPMFSPDRSRAFELMQAKCPQGYRVAREGEAQGFGNVSGLQEGTEDEPIGRRWGIQLRCK